MRVFETDLGVFTVPDAPKIKTKSGEITLHALTPIKVPIELVQANNYNPNNVPRNNMELLKQSILDNGFTFPVVTVFDEELRKFVIVDGFHRYTIFKDWLQADEIVIVVLEHNIAQRMAATVQFNRARGVHQVELMGDLVQSLVKQGLTDEEIAKHLGMEFEEVYRLKQITGIAELFKNQPYSKAWEMMEVDEHV
ncbi:chromosome partitioning protein ParB [Geobacillus sp. MMMUD3]|nr:chromosome partitioning protein ParB [Geobacillus sp. MMMUD3]